MVAKKNNYFLRIVLIIFIIFMGLYISVSNNSCQNQLHDEVILTEANMKEFEEDVKAGKPLDLKKYQNISNHDYGNLFSNTGNFLGKKLDYVMLNGTDDAIKVLKKLFSN